MHLFCVPTFLTLAVSPLECGGHTAEIPLLFPGGLEESLAPKGQFMNTCPKSGHSQHLPQGSAMALEGLLAR